MAEKLCVFCEHYWNEPYYQYSEMTDGGGFMKCQKEHIESHWDHSGELADFRKAITFAEKCPDYAPPPQGDR